MPLLGWAQNWLIKKKKKKKKRPWWPNQPIYTLPKSPISKLGGQLQLLALGIQESSEVARDDKEARQGRIKGV